MAELIPWDELEAQYAEQFHASLGAPAKSLRLALGALLAKERLHCSDSELVEHFEENPYLQYFLGLETFHKDCPFDDSSLTNFRKYLGKEALNQVNETVIAKLEKLQANQQQEDEPEPEKESGITSGPWIPMAKVSVLGSKQQRTKPSWTPYQIVTGQNLLDAKHSSLR